MVYPPVSVADIKSKRKENLIIYVGRFSELLQSKNQDVLIKAFKKLFNSGFDNWKLTLAGGVEMGLNSYVAKLRKMSRGFPIEIVESPDFKALKELYGKAKIFWSGVGYDEDENKFPEKVEHFGMTVVEAMAAGCVPVVYNAGGHKEIVHDGINGFTWNNPSMLISKTKKLISGNGVYRAVSNESKKESQKFSYEQFRKEIMKLI